MLVPRDLHRLGDAVLKSELRVQARHRRDPRRRGALPVEPGGHRVVGQLRAVPHDRAVDLGRARRPVGAQRHLDDEREALLPLAERGEIGREPLGQHGEDPPGRVDGRRVGPRVAVERRTAADQRVDVRDRDEDLHLPGGQRLGDGELVEVARVVVVDRAPEPVAEVADRGIARDGGRRQRADLGQDRRREVGLEPALAHRPPRDRLEITPRPHRRAHSSAFPPPRRRRHRGARAPLTRADGPRPRARSAPGRTSPLGARARGGGGPVGPSWGRARARFRARAGGTPWTSRCGT